MNRARATAEPAAPATSRALQIDARLRELDFGRIEGKTIAEAEQLFPDEVRRFKSDPVSFPLPGGEDPHEAARRAQAALRDIAAAYPGERVLVVDHNTFIRPSLCRLLGIPLPSAVSFFPQCGTARSRNSPCTRKTFPSCSTTRLSPLKAFPKPNFPNFPLCMSTCILVAGDHFILPATFADAIRAQVKDQDLEFSEYQSPWPGVPFGNIGEVTEASGSEEEAIRALQGVGIYVANHSPLTKKVLEGALDLRLAVIARGGRRTRTSKPRPSTACSSATLPAVTRRPPRNTRST